MKKVLGIIYILFSLFSLHAVETENGLDAEFDMVFTKVGVSDFGFIDPADVDYIKGSSYSAFPDKVQSFDFDSYTGGDEALKARIGVGWNIYEPEFSLFVSFIDGDANPESGWMLSPEDDSVQVEGYNFKVTVNGIENAGVISPATADTKLENSLARTIYLFGSVDGYHTAETTPFRGGAVLECALTPPGAIPSGQYNGYVVMTLRTE